MHSMPWGKHCGKPLFEVPAEYIQWLLANLNLDFDIKHALETELNTRRAAHRKALAAWLEKSHEE